MGWSGDCAGSGACRLTLDRDRAVVADFDAGVSLTVGLAGEGSGWVTADGLACAVGACSGTYRKGAQITVTPVPDPTDVASFFSGWDGVCSGTGSCSLTLDGDTAVTANFGLLRHNLSVSIRHDGGGTGRVVSDPPGISCDAGTCSGSFVLGRTIKLSAAPGSARFVRWGGACSGTGTCQFTGTADATVSAVFLGANYVFATSTDFLPNDVSLTRADAECAARATAAGLPGTYVAWMSTSTVAARDRLGSSQGWVRLDGLPFADSVASIIAGQQKYPVLFDENQRPLARPDVLTGTNMDGTLAAGYNCGDWSNTTDNVIMGKVTTGGRSFSQEAYTACSSGLRYHVYCFGTDVTATLPPSTPQGRIAFVSNSELQGNASGLPEFDLLCEEEAIAAGLTGSYKALVATSTASAISRFDLTGAPWVRPDGVQVAATPSDLASGNLLAPLNLWADGSYRQPFRAWSGSAIPAAIGSIATTCSDWTDATLAWHGAYGSPDFTSASAYEYPAMSFFGGGFTGQCDWFASVYCLQE
ncbi:hypothetical protein AMPC_16780 [Anaeromyxobacter paludicola]|uniref:Bacterial repeat domain-containing protein n=2 Tax=Anaeromyxobacter paludicola TaxID=2918171 RepID=A0ABN6N963_9BACT|nr:hypothetical protein AMPC_16780 [Anaeromyxobacter paludicola]